MKAAGFGPLVYVGYIGAGLLLSACGDETSSKKSSPQNDEEDCHKQELPNADEKVYAAADYRVITDPRVNAETAQFFLSRIPQVQKDIAEFFALPAQTSATVWLVDENSVHHDVCKDAPACWDQGSVYLFFSEKEFAQLNQFATAGKILHADTFVHEFVHALPIKLIPTLEEGLARYGEVALTNTELQQIPTEAASLIYETSIVQGDILLTAEQDLPVDLQSLQILAYKESEQLILVGYTKKGEREDQTAAFFNGQAFVEGRLVVQVLAHDDKFEVKIYDHPKDSLLVGPIERLCYEDGWENIIQKQVLTETGEYIDLVEEEKFGSYVAAEKVDGKSLPYEVYETNYCFFELTREKYGHEAVQRLIQSVYEFYQVHPDEEISYDFFTEYIKATGASVVEAREHFARFYVPTNPEGHLYGGMCW